MVFFLLHRVHPHRLKLDYALGRRAQTQENSSMAFVIGTAGHIDHGKTALVRALTGQETDGLRAEKERGISIDLGFASFRLADGRKIGVVDVPGHERFIRNMVAGAHGINLVLFVVAADDGIMPQSEEHFDILRLLGIRHAIFVVTKIDCVGISRFDDVVEEIGLLTDGSIFDQSPIHAVSNTSGEGIETLKALIAAQLIDHRKQSTDRPFRMPIDRVFNIQGRGVVVTGTALSGKLTVGDEVACLPDGKNYRTRGLQEHGQDVDQGTTGQRMAINLSRAERQDFRRGDVICDTLIARNTARFDVELAVLQSFRSNFKNGQRVRIHLGTAERLGAVICFDNQWELPALAQITLLDSMHILAGDHFVIRDEQGEHTLGGGIVLDPLGEKLSRKDATRLTWLQALTKGQFASAIQALTRTASCLGALADDLVFRLNLDRREFHSVVSQHPDLTEVDTSTGCWICNLSRVDELVNSIINALSEYHLLHPLSMGQSLDIIRQKLAPSADTALFQALVDQAANAGTLLQQAHILSLPGHRPMPSKDEELRIAAIMARLNAEPFSPQNFDTDDEVNQVLISYLERQGMIVRIGTDILFAASAFRSADEILEQHFSTNETITAAQYRDLLATSRKFALGLLESFDRTGRTIRLGDIRKRGNPPATGQD
ncbi:MAG: selenocysteine-specific elongation factor [Paracoccaceae bacterium]